MTFAVSEQIQTASKPNLNPFKLNAEQNALTYILIRSSMQYINIHSSNITTQLLVFCCGTALECDFLTIFPRCINHYCVVIIQRHDENLCWSCPQPTHFSALRLELPTM